MKTREEIKAWISALEQLPHFGGVYIESDELASYIEALRWVLDEEEVEK